MMIAIRRFHSLFFSALMVSVLMSSSAHAIISLFDFQANGLAATQQSGGNTYTGQFSWNPEVDLGLFGVRGNLGASYMKGTMDNKFLAYNYQAFLKLSLIGPLIAELGGGMESWSGNGGTHPILSGNLALEVPGLLLGLNRLFLGYSRFNLPNNTTSEYRAGIGFSL